MFHYFREGGELNNSTAQHMTRRTSSVEQRTAQPPAVVQVQVWRLTKASRISIERERERTAVWCGVVLLWPYKTTVEQGGGGRKVGKARAALSSHVGIVVVVVVSVTSRRIT